MIEACTNQFSVSTPATHLRLSTRDGAINKKCTHLHFLAFLSRLLHFYSHLHLQVLLYTHCNIICTGTHPQTPRICIYSQLLWPDPTSFAFTRIYSLDQESQPLPWHIMTKSPLVQDIVKDIRACSSFPSDLLGEILSQKMFCDGYVMKIEYKYLEG